MTGLPPWLPAPLFCPGDRPDRFDKALAAADGVILDLEDGVAPMAKEGARRVVATRLPEMDLDRVIVRVNARGSAWHEDDISAVSAAGATTVMLPKAQAPQDITGCAPLQVIALCETAEGVLASRELGRAHNCVALMWGAEDLIADLGGHASRDAAGAFLPVVQHARMQLLLAAAASAVMPLDGVFLNLEDQEGLAAEASESATTGYVGKVAIHPQQVSAIRAAFQPAPERTRWARAVLSEAKARRAGGVFRFEGHMVDGPLLDQARRVVEAADRYVR